MANPQVTVVMNCYNGERFLREAIDSVLDQSHRDWELLFWDNHSTDRSAEIVQSYRDPRIRYRRAPRHTHLGEARKLAVEEATGEFLAFLDTDDLFLPDMLRQQLALIQASGAAVAYGGMLAINLEGATLYQYHPHCRTGMVFDSMLRQFDVPVPTMLLRRAVLQQESLNFDEQIHGSEEYALLMQLAVAHPFAVNPEPVAKVRMHRGSLTYSVMDKWASDRLYVLDRIRARHPGIENRFRGGFREAYARANYYRARWLVAEGRRSEALQELRQAVGAGWRYLGLYGLLATSTKGWNWVHARLPSART